MHRRYSPGKAGHRASPPPALRSQNAQPRNRATQFPRGKTEAKASTFRGAHHWGSKRSFDATQGGARKRALPWASLRPAAPLAFRNYSFIRYTLIYDSSILPTHPPHDVTTCRGRFWLSRLARPARARTGAGRRDGGRGKSARAQGPAFPGARQAHRLHLHERRPEPRGYVRSEAAAPARRWQAVPFRAAARAICRDGQAFEITVELPAWAEAGCR